MKALDSIAMRPDESWLSATARFSSAFRTTVVEPDRPHATEADSFWRCGNEYNLKDLMERLACRLALSDLEHDGVIVVESKRRALPVEGREGLRTR